MFRRDQQARALQPVGIGFETQGQKQVLEGPAGARDQRSVQPAAAEPRAHEHQRPTARALAHAPLLQELGQISPVHVAGTRRQRIETVVQRQRGIGLERAQQAVRVGGRRHARRLAALLAPGLPDRRPGPGPEALGLEECQGVGIAGGQPQHLVARAVILDPRRVLRARTEGAVDQLGDGRNVFGVDWAQ